jgi:hypothetical protein
MTPPVLVDDRTFQIGAAQKIVEALTVNRIVPPELSFDPGGTLIAKT